MESTFSRRALLGAGAAGLTGALIPFPEWFGRYGVASAQTPVVRSSIATPAGQAMLADYRLAVTRMMAKEAGNPCSWIFQWYTHEVRDDLDPTGNGDKTIAVSGLPVAFRPLANEVWSTCQAHFGRPTRFFLPWHRMYVYFLERMVRKESGNPNWALPYWNYLDPAQRALPAAFRTSTTGSLYRPDRNTGSNNGSAIDAGNPGGYDAACMNEGAYDPTPGRLGFCATVNGNPHGIVHSMIGNSRGMGRVPWAANDPIFWLHHANIDRMWESWLVRYANPTDAGWLDKTFVFADENCNRVVVKVSDFLSIANLGYSYDALIPMVNVGLVERLRRLLRVTRWPPPIPGPGPLGGRAPIVLRREPITIPLSSAVRSQFMREQALLRRAAEVRLTVGGLRTNADPGILYNIFLGRRAGGGRRPTRIRVGTITFFDAVVRGGHDHPGAELQGPSFNFDVTNAVRRLGPGAQLDVTIAPSGQPAREAVPVVGEIELFAG